MGQRFEGHNLEEALNNAATAFGVERYRLTYHVVLEKRGFLGGMKRVVIEAEVNDEAAQPSASASSLPEAGEGGGARAPRDRGRGGRRRGRGDRREERERDPRPPEMATEVPAQGPESEMAAAVRAWLEKVLSLAKLDSQVRSEENEQQIILKVYGRDANRLIDHHGELLDALQVLANKALLGRKAEKDIEIDCAAFKERRMEELGERARATADRVRRDGREQLLPAMSPIERRIVHLALQNDQDVTTESRGDGFYKRVAVIPRPAEQSSES